MPDKLDGGKVAYVWFVGQIFKKTQPPLGIARVRINLLFFISRWTLMDYQD